jgi:glycosyltransferase involved in cell wall biosynthesis
MNSDIAFTVLISSFNYADYVVETVNSALSQTHAPLEVIVVDDGSTDASVQRLNEAFSHNPKVRIVVQANNGQLSAWITGCAMAQGDVIALLDSDDLWKSDYLEKTAQIYRSIPSVDYVYSNMELFGARNGLMLKRARHRHDRDLGLSTLMGACIQRWQGVATSGNTLKRALLQKILQLPADQIQEWKTRPDDCLFYGSDILGAHKYYVSEALVMHREHGSNALQEFSQSPIKNARYAIRVERMLDHYRRVIGFSPSWLKLAKSEFRTKPRPTASECWLYCNLAWQAPTRMSVRISQVSAIFSHYVRCSFKAPSSRT